MKLPMLSADRAARAKVVSIMNNKGGCGKTTSAIALGLHLARAGQNVLFWDNDPQSNLSQRLGLPDGKYREQRVDQFFRNADREDFDEELVKLSMIARYPYFYRLQGAASPPGMVGIMGGAHTAEIEAKSMRDKLQLNTYLEPERRNLFRTFALGMKFFKNYFDYIIMDTSPAMEGNFLCQLAVRTADEIVCPVDGLEAAMGLKTFCNWVYAETDPENGVVKRPNLMFAMIKYQEDTQNLKEVTQHYRLRNAVYRALKESLGDFVCDNGIKELPSLRNKVYGGFGRKTNYEELSNEMAFKMSSHRPQFFNHWDRHVSNRLMEALSQIEMKTLEKRPDFKKPRFVTTRGVAADVNEQG